MSKGSIKKIISCVFLFLGLLCLLYPSIHSYKSKLEQQALIASLDVSEPVVLSFVEDDISVSDEPVASLDTITYTIGDCIGILSIPSLDVESVIVEGTSSSELEMGIGHIVGSGLFSGNTVLAAHRATYFKHLDNLSIGSSILLSNLSEGLYEYIVYESFIVSPDEVWVVEDIGDDIITLVTCTNGNKDRLIVRAKLEQ